MIDRVWRTGDLNRLSFDFDCLRNAFGDLSEYRSEDLTAPRADQSADAEDLAFSDTEGDVLHDIPVLDGGMGHAQVLHFHDNIADRYTDLGIEVFDLAPTISSIRVCSSTSWISCTRMDWPSRRTITRSQIRYTSSSLCEI